MQCTIFAILPTWAVFSLSLSLPLQVLPIIINIISTDGKQDVLTQPEANPDLLYLVSGLSFKKTLLKQIPLCLLSHSHIRIIMLTCPDNIDVIYYQSARNRQPKSCVPAKSHKSQIMMWGQYIFPSKSSLPFSLFLFVRRLESTITNS